MREIAILLSAAHTLHDSRQRGVCLAPANPVTFGSRNWIHAPPLSRQNLRVAQFPMTKRKKIIQNRCSQTGRHRFRVAEVFLHTSCMDSVPQDEFLLASAYQGLKWPFHALLLPQVRGCHESLVVIWPVRAPRIKNMPHEKWVILQRGKNPCLRTT